MKYILPLLLLLTACADVEEHADTPSGNLEALWHIMDEHYCFFEEKGVDWQQVYREYMPQMDRGMTASQQFEVMTRMLSVLRDGHVNLYAPFDTGRNWSWHEDHPANYADTLERRYLGTDYRMASGLKYRVLSDNVGYLRCASFASGFGDGNLDDILSYLAPCRKLIIDVRGNGGGLITAAEQLAARFTNRTLTVGYMRHKRGPGHGDFSPMEAQTLRPSSGVRWQKDVVVLTNRSVYSAANEFVKYMRCCPHVTTVGDQTGGGAGMPFSSELPIGWSVRFSACPMYDADKHCTEEGIRPDHEVALTEEDLARGVDTIIEYARKN